jgi:hypothetical protein
MGDGLRNCLERIFVIVAVNFLYANAVFAQEYQDKQELNFQASTQQIGISALKLDFPLLDFPYQIDTMGISGYGFFGSYTSPGMDQSLALTLDLYSSMHFGMRKLYDNLDIAPMWKNAIYYGGTAAGILAFAYLLPFGYPWMQQEFTRSILSRLDIKSVNGSYDIFNGGPVIGVTDVQLERFKAEKPHDMIRMDEAGSESYILFSDHMVRNVFFYDLNNLSNWTALIAALLGGVGHNFGGVAADYFGANYVDDNIKSWYKNDEGEKSRPLYVDSGINWVYDLFRPDEPYADRGAHPLGGIARYITWEQLSDDERQYLIKQGWLSYLNIISPLYYGFNSFPLGKTGIEWNVALHHYLTSFGSDVPVQLFLKKAPFNMLFTYHNYQNYQNYFPAIEAELMDLPVQFTPKFGLLLSPRLLLGMQPKDQVFMTGASEFLGLLGCRVDFSVSKHLFPYFDLTLKTDGWVAGNEYLESNISFKAGVSLRF